MTRVYAAAGCKVAMIDFDTERLKRVAKEIADEGGEVLPIFADVTRRTRSALSSGKCMPSGAASTFW